MIIPNPNYYDWSNMPATKNNISEDHEICFRITKLLTLKELSLSNIIHGYN